MLEPHSTTSYLSARLQLARLDVDGDRLERILERATRLTADQLGVERVSIWFFDADRQILRLALLYERSLERHTRPELSIPLAAAPAYFAAIEERRAVAINDVSEHPVTAALFPLYLAPAGIVSMLDAPIFRHGTVVGVVCHEHVGTPREWPSRDVDFAASVADMVALYCEEASALATEKLLRAQEKELASAERLASVGVVARYIAHDLNNAVAPILMCGQKLRSLLAADAKLLEHVAIIINAAEHGASLARRLLDSGVDKLPQEEVVVVDVLLEDARPLLAALMGDGHTLRIDRGASLAAVRIDPVELTRALINLLTNARDAMKGREGEVLMITERIKDEIRIQVVDRGHGMSEAVKDRLFQPFFTTKPHQGYGLGLSGVRMLMERVGGRVEVSSQSGVGTTVTLVLRALPPQP